MAESLVSNYTVDGADLTSAHIETYEMLLQAFYNVLVNWAGIPGSQVKVGLAGRFTVGAFPIMLRVRAGDRPPANSVGGGDPTSIAGAIVYSVLLAAGTTIDLGAEGSFFDKPSGAMVISTLQITVQAQGGPSIITTQGGLAMTVTPDESGVGTGLMLSDGASAGGPTGSAEVVGAGVGFEWAVNFDEFATAPNLRFTFAVYEIYPYGGDNLTVRLRVGGSHWTADGMVVVAVVDDNGSQAPYEYVIAGSAVVPNVFSGTLLVKMTWQGRAGPGHPTVIIGAA